MIKKKRGRGRPPLPRPEPIPATPEDLAKAIMQAPPKKRWRYDEEHEQRRTAAKNEK